MPDDRRQSAARRGFIAVGRLRPARPPVRREWVGKGRAVDGRRIPTLRGSSWRSRGDRTATKRRRVSSRHSTKSSSASVGAFRARSSSSDPASTRTFLIFPRSSARRRYGAVRAPKDEPDRRFTFLTPALRGSDDARRPAGAQSCEIVRFPADIWCETDHDRSGRELALIRIGLETRNPQQRCRNLNPNTQGPNRQARSRRRTPFRSSSPMKHASSSIAARRDGCRIGRPNG